MDSKLFLGRIFMMGCGCMKFRFFLLFAYIERTIMLNSDQRFLKGVGSYGLVTGNSTVSQIGVLVVWACQLLMADGSSKKILSNCSCECLSRSNLWVSSSLVASNTVLVGTILIDLLASFQMRCWHFVRSRWNIKSVFKNSSREVDFISSLFTIGWSMLRIFSRCFYV